MSRPPPLGPTDVAAHAGTSPLAGTALSGDPRMSRGDPKMVFHLWAGEEACIVLAIYGRPVVLWVCANPPLDPAYFIPQAPPAIRVQRAAAAAARARYEGYLYLHSTRLNPRAGCGKRGSLAGRVLRRPVLTSVSVSLISLQLPGSVPWPTASPAFPHAGNAPVRG